MDGLSLGGIVIRFFLGGGAVAGSSLLAKRVGGRFGGIFASFPAVYLAALFTTHLDAGGGVLLRRSVVLSRGALIGMVADIVCALLAGLLCARKGWKVGLSYAVGCWLIVSCVIALFTI